MRVGLIGPTYPYRGGIAHYTTCLCNTLRESHEVKFISFSRQYPKFIFPGRSDKDNSEQPLTAEEVEYIIDSMNPFTWIRAANTIVKFEPQILVIPWWVVFWTPQFWTIIKTVRRKLDSQIVILCHNAMEHESHPVKNWATKAILRQADRILTHSEQDTEQIKAMLGESKQVVTAFHPTYAPMVRDVPSREESRQSLALQGNVILFFGFVRQYKGLDVLIEAMPHILLKKPVTLLVVGEFWKDKDVYLNRIKELGLEPNIRIVDEYIPDEEVGKFFSAADLVVQPYHTASGSGVSQLAYGFGRPVIATNVGNLPEVIDDGVNGRIVAAGEVEALARAILESLDPSVLDRLNTNAARTKERFSWDRLVRIICDW